MNSYKCVVTLVQFDHGDTTLNVLRDDPCQHERTFDKDSMTVHKIQPIPIWPHHGSILDHSERDPGPDLVGAVRDRQTGIRHSIVHARRDRGPSRDRLFRPFFRPDRIHL